MKRASLTTHRLTSKTNSGKLKFLLSKPNGEISKISQPLRLLQNLFPTGLPMLVSISKPGSPCTFPSYPRVLLGQRKSYFPRKGIYLNNFPYPSRKSHFAREIFIFCIGMEKRSGKALPFCEPGWTRRSDPSSPLSTCPSEPWVVGRETVHRTHAQWPKWAPQNPWGFTHPPNQNIS